MKTKINKSFTICLLPDMLKMHKDVDNKREWLLTTQVNDYPESLKKAIARIYKYQIHVSNDINLFDVADEKLIDNFEVGFDDSIGSITYTLSRDLLNKIT